MSYTTTTTRASAPESPTPSDQHPADFAREATIAAFGGRAIQALDNPNFEDRRPDHGPRSLGKIAAEVTNNTAMKAVRHWLNEAGRADTDEKRQAALEIAHEIARLAGIDLAEKEAA